MRTIILNGNTQTHSSLRKLGKMNNAHLLNRGNNFVIVVYLCDLYTPR